MSLRTSIVLALCMLCAIILTPHQGSAELKVSPSLEVSNLPTVTTPIELTNASPSLPSTCAVQPEINRSGRTIAPPFYSGSLSLSHFRNAQLAANSLQPVSDNRVNYIPREFAALADPTNYGQRFFYDLNGKPANLRPIVVIHETVDSAANAVKFFRTPHPDEDNQSSYHTLITLEGDIIYIVPPDMRAYGAGNSVFQGESGAEAVKTHPDYPPSVNNFAYHISLETPPDGNHNGNSHSGYTLAQYQSLAWLVSKTGVPENRITTHQRVDRSGTRKDPRSFDFATFQSWLQAFPKSQEIVIGCQ